MSSTPNPYAARPVILIPPKRKGINKSYPFLRLLFVLMGILVVWNMNLFANLLAGNGQLFSPVILLIAIMAYANCRIAQFSGLPTTAKYFAISMIAVLSLGVLAKIATNLGSPVALAGLIVKDGASIIVLFGAVWLTSSMKKIQGELAERQILTIMFFLSLVGVLTIFIPLYFPQWHYFVRGDNRAFVRFGGVYDNPNNASAASLTFMICGLAKSAQTNQLRYLLIAFAIGSAGIILTGSRIGILCTVFIVVPLAVFLFGFRHVIRFAVSVTIVSTVVLIIYLTLNSQLDSAINSQAKRAESLLNILKYGLDDETTGGRTTLASIAIKMWKKSPVFGNGLGSSRPMLPYTELGPHNYYLTVLVETGVIGLLVFLALWAMMGASAFRGTIPHWLRVMIVGIFLALSAYSLSSHTVFFVRNQIFLLGAALGLSYKSNSEGKGILPKLKQN